MIHTNLDGAVPNLISSSYFHILSRLPSVSVSNHLSKGNWGGGGLRAERGRERDRGEKI